MFKMGGRPHKVDIQLWWYTNIQVGNIQPPLFQLKEIKNISLMFFKILEYVIAGKKKKASYICYLFFNIQKPS
jgi:hypothetical protein